MLVIQARAVEIRLYTPGYFGSAQSIPKETSPISKLSAIRFIGPPLNDDKKNYFLKI